MISPAISSTAVWLVLVITETLTGEPILAPVFCSTRWSPSRNLISKRSGRRWLSSTKTVLSRFTTSAGNGWPLISIRQVFVIDIQTSSSGAGSTITVPIGNRIGSSTPLYFAIARHMVGSPYSA